MVCAFQGLLMMFGVVGIIIIIIIIIITINITAAGAVDRELLYIEVGNLLPPTATTAARATATTTQTPHSRAHPQDYGHRPNSFKLLLLLLSDQQVDLDLETR